MPKPDTQFELDTSALADYLQSSIDGFQGPVSVARFSDGQSNPTYRLTAGSGAYVLRRKPPGTLLKSAHAVDREYRVIQALQGTRVPVARPYHLCNDETVIGSMFYIMQYVDGRVLWDPALPQMSNDERAAHYESMNSVLANLHQIDFAAVGLLDYGKPGGFISRQIELWSRQYRASELERIDDMENLLHRLPQVYPGDDGRTALIHGDFRLDNMMFDQATPEVAAVLDWELSTLGHPLADLAYQCMQLRMPHAGLMSGLGGMDREALGIPSEEDYVASYCRKMNLQNIPHWEFYLAFSFFRFAAILQGVKKRAVDGNASSSNAMKMGELVAPLARMGLELVA